MSVSENLASPIAIAAIYGSKWDWDRFWAYHRIIIICIGTHEYSPYPGIGRRTYYVYHYRNHHRKKN